jgi:murein DD-endopeptidase MepM/ murein hydrolase activator NlpD
LKAVLARAALFAGAALIAWYALQRTPPEAHRPAELFGSTRAASSVTRPDTLDRGETLDKVLRRGGLDDETARAVLGAAMQRDLDPRRLKPGMPVEFVHDSDGAPPRQIVLKLDIDRHLRITRDSAGAWTAEEERLPWTTDTVVVRGVVEPRGTLMSSLSDLSRSLFPGSAYTVLVNRIANVYEYRVDMSREIQPGDSVYALVERSRGPEATTRVGSLLATRLLVGGRPIEAFLFPDSGRRPKYYDSVGKSLATAFLRMPVEFGRLTSSFGMRFHPILKINRAHQGTDYGAPAGTPVRAIADGVVRSAVYNPGGYGNLVEIAHANGIVSRYAHLRGFARGVRSRVSVRQGEVIGYVGATGLATAPHLHFELLVGGKPNNPAVVLRRADGTPVASREKPAFDRTRESLSALLHQAEGVVRGIARADVSQVMPESAARGRSPIR